VNLSELDPTVFERAAASVLNAKTTGVASLGLFCEPDAEPYACWAISTAVNGPDEDVDDDEPHIAAFRYLFSPDEKGKSYFWDETASAKSQNERAIALLLMADIVRSEQRQTTVNDGQPSSTPPSGASAA